jgi:CheY-like chemotaxis protein
MKNTETICLIDDDEVSQFVSKRIISGINPGIQISSYLNGEEALNAFKNILASGQLLPGIILLDINMPVMDGWQFMDEFSTLKSQINQSISIYMTSSSLDKTDVSRTKLYEDIKGFLPKPMDREAFMKVISPET